jgi:hypothetical protein
LGDPHGRNSKKMAALVAAQKAGEVLTPAEDAEAPLVVIARR